MTSVIQRLVKSAHCAKGESGVIHSEAPPISTVHNGQSDVIHTAARPISTRGSANQHSAQRPVTQRLLQSAQRTKGQSDVIHTEARPIKTAHNGQSHRGSANQNSAQRPVTQRLGQSEQRTTASHTEARPISTLHNGQSDVIHTEARPISARASRKGPRQDDGGSGALTHIEARLAFRCCCQAMKEALSSVRLMASWSLLPPPPGPASGPSGSKCAILPGARVME